MDIVAALLTLGAGLDEADRWGFTPLGAAVSQGHVSTIEALIHAGADLNARDRCGV